MESHGLCCIKAHTHGAVVVYLWQLVFEYYAALIVKAKEAGRTASEEEEPYLLP